MVKESVMDQTTNAAAGVGVLQYLYLPAVNPWLQTVFLCVSIVWVLTQIYFKWFGSRKDN
jgi:hypothetical protein